MWRFFTAQGQEKQISGANTGGLVLLWDSIDAAVALPAASVTTPTLTGTYKHIIIEFTVRNSSGSQQFFMQFNGDTGANYYYQNIQATGTTLTTATSAAQTTLFLGVSGTGENCGGSARIIHSKGTSWEKSYVVTSQCQNDGSATHKMWTCGGMWNNTAAISTITFLHAAGNISAGSRISVFGEV